LLRLVFVVHSHPRVFLAFDFLYGYTTSSSHSHPRTEHE